MSVYIPGMEMPKDGFITITVTSDGRVVGNSKKENGKFEYLDNEDIAKAVPVPPHGRLGDLDNLRKELETICDRYDAGIISEVVCMNMMLQAVISATTIIPADPAEEG